MKTIDNFNLTGKIPKQIAALNRTLLSFLLVVFSTYSMADDLEIYNGLVDQSGQGVLQRSVLFILDSSRSMQGERMTTQKYVKAGKNREIRLWNESSDGNYYDVGLKNELAEFVPSDKRRNMEDTMVELLEGIVGSEIRIGLSRYNGQHGGAISYPVTPIGDLAKTITGEDALPGNGGSFAKGEEMITLADFRDDYWDERPGGTTIHLPNNPSGNITTQRGGQYYAAFYNLPLARNSEVVSAKLLVSIEDEANNDNPTNEDLDKPDGTPVKDYFSQGKAKVKILRSVNPPRLPAEGGSTYKTALRDYYAQQFGSTEPGIIEDSTIVPTTIRDAVIFGKKLWVSIDIKPALLMKLIDTPPSADPTAPTPLWRMRNYHTTPPYTGAGNEPANGALFQVTFETPFKLRSNPSKAVKLGNYSSLFPLQDAPQLHLQYDKSVRQRLIELTAHNSPFNSVGGSGGTPILESLLESYYYWAGKQVKYGKTRSKYPDKTYPHSKDSRVSHLGALASVSGYALNGCTVENYNEAVCGEEQFSSATYDSPIKSCNLQVLLTDGAPTSNDPEARKIVNDLITTKDSSKSNCYSGTNLSSAQTGRTPQAECIAELAEYMNTTDLDTGTEGMQTVNTHVIAFGDFNAALGADSTEIVKDQAVLENTALDGGGKYYEANDTSKLLFVLKDTLAASIPRAPSVSTPVITTDAQNSLQTRSALYLTQFQPAGAPSWEGNVKKYFLCIDTATTRCSGNKGKVVDVNNELVYEDIVSPETKKKDFTINSGAKSFWASTELSDVRVTEGGAGARLRDAAPRQLYIGNAADDELFSYNAPADWNDSALSATRTAVCINVDGISLLPGGEEDCKDLMQGLLSNEAGGNRWMHRNVVHSAPTPIYYGNTSAGDPIYKVLYGTNDGILHFVNDDTGAEDWGLLPNRFLRQQASVINGTRNLGATAHTYGFDLTPTILIRNSDGGGITPSAAGDSDSVWAFVGLRRGGSALYAFDLTGSAPLQNQTDSVVPVIKWVIENDGTPNSDFERLGMTFSQPTTAKMMVDGVLTDVLVFGGGYDPALDAVEITGSRGKPSRSGSGGLSSVKGNDVYIVNAYTGVFLYSLSENTSIQSELTHSVPSAIAVMDSDGDDVDDRLYFGDTGGQVWRMDVTSLSVSGTDVVVADVLASLGDSSETGRRRFFEPPVVARVTDTLYSTNPTYDYILIGSGNRARPVGDNTTQDRFYAIRDYQVGQRLTPSTYPIKNSTTINASTSNPITSSITIAVAQSIAAATGNSIRNGDLSDVTTTSADFLNVNGTEGAKSKNGWYINMRSKEKVFSPAALFPTTISAVENTNAADTAAYVTSAVYVNSYAPPAARANVCADVEVGYSYERAYDLISTKRIIKEDDGKIVLETAGNERTETASGLAPLPPTAPQSADEIARLSPGGKGAENFQTKKATRTYWYSD